MHGYKPLLDRLQDLLVAPHIRTGRRVGADDHVAERLPCLPRAPGPRNGDLPVRPLEQPVRLTTGCTSASAERTVTLPLDAVATNATPMPAQSPGADDSRGWLEPLTTYSTFGQSEGNCESSDRVFSPSWERLELGSFSQPWIGRIVRNGL